MCGILGVASARLVDDRGWLASGSADIRHRGPDDSGEWWSADGRVGLGHRRLAIIDLSAAGHQPMVSEDRNLCVAFNGEIYNFRELREALVEEGYTFHSKSDTEVILVGYRHWGVDCLSRLNGMFAFAIYDATKGQLFLARDRAGEKPLYYSMFDRSIVFASELKALLLHPRIARHVDRYSLDCYLAEGFVPAGRSMISGIQKLLPAHALTFDLKSGEFRGWRYWQLPAPPPLQSTVNGELLTEELQALLGDAVKRQLVADVPTGVLLSGGVDSSLVTALAAEARPRIKTFTVRFPGHGRHDETEHARLIARHFGTEHIELDAEPDSVSLLPLLAKQFDEPLNDSSMVPTYLVSRLVRQFCTVVLGGDGADELFGGYSHYERLLRLESLAGRIPQPVRRAVGRAGSRLPIGMKGRNWLQASGSNFGNEVPLIAQYFDLRSRCSLLNRRGGWDWVAERNWIDRQSGHGDLLQRATRLDFEGYLSEDILVKVDRASMLNSLEVRAPMLDSGVIEFALGRVPSRLKTVRGGRKVILRKLAGRLLPKEFNQARKQGFSIPLRTWLQSGPWLSFFREVLFDSSQVLFDQQFVQSQFKGLANGRANEERLFGLVMFELWRREYRVEMGDLVEK